jgi:predicted secreted protein
MNKMAKLVTTLIGLSSVVTTAFAFTPPAPEPVGHAPNTNWMTTPGFFLCTSSAAPGLVCPSFAGDKKTGAAVASENPNSKFVIPFLFLPENGAGKWQPIGAYASLLKAYFQKHPQSAEYVDTETNDLFLIPKSLYKTLVNSSDALPQISFLQAQSGQVATFYIKKRPANAVAPIIIPASDATTSWSDVPGLTPSLLTIGQEYVLQLPANPSTGYRWSYAQLPAGSGPLQIGQARFTADSKLLGSAGNEYLPILPIKTGNAQLVCTYGRAGEPPVESLYYSFYAAQVVSQSDASTGTNPVVVVLNGESFGVQLSVNAGTGYSWVNTSTSTNLSAGTSYNLPAQNQNSVGGPVTTMYPYTGNAVGAGSVQFTEYDPSQNAVQILNFPVLVNPAPLGTEPNRWADSPNNPAN